MTLEDQPHIFADLSIRCRNIFFLAEYLKHVLWLGAIHRIHVIIIYHDGHALLDFPHTFVLKCDDSKAPVHDDVQIPS